MAVSLLLGLAMANAGCGGGSVAALSNDERSWCADTANGSTNVYLVAHAMDTLAIPEPSPGYLRARMESRGHMLLGDSRASWVLAAAGDPGLIAEFAINRPAEYARACRTAYDARGYIRRRDGPSP